MSWLPLKLKLVKMKLPKNKQTNKKDPISTQRHFKMAAEYQNLLLEGHLHEKRLF